jgi:hypothetical protein
MLPATGFERSEIFEISAKLEQLGVTILWHRTAWDKRLLSLARGGFFTFWESIKRNRDTVLNLL